MRIHTSKFQASAVIDALQAEIAAGRIADHVSFKTLSEHRSTIRDLGIEVQLMAERRDNGRRAGNSGSYGAMRPEVDGFAATFDEWGWLLAALYKLDDEMVVGDAKYPVYAHSVDFHHRTALTYAPQRLIVHLGQGFDPYPIVVGRAARTKRGYFIGRRGASRVASQPDYWPGRHRPRTVAEVREFAHLD